MKLNHWLKQNSFTHDAFIEHAKNNGSNFSRHALAKWCRGVRIPRKDEMHQIHNLTAGNVSANDFYDL